MSTSTSQQPTGTATEDTANQEIAATNPGNTELPQERADLLQTLAQHRHFLRFTARDLTDAQGVERTTASALCIGGLIKHVAAAERGWVDFILQGTSALGSFSDWSQEAITARENEFRLLEGETLAGVLEDYAEVAWRTDEMVATLPSLDVAHLLPEAPWFESGATWSARRALLHIIAETAQHAGHADIIRESIDGAKTMG